MKIIINFLIVGLLVLHNIVFAQTGNKMPLSSKDFSKISQGKEIKVTLISGQEIIGQLVSTQQYEFTICDSANNYSLIFYNDVEKLERYKHGNLFIDILVLPTLIVTIPFLIIYCHYANCKVVDVIQPEEYVY